MKTGGVVLVLALVNALLHVAHLKLLREKITTFKLVPVVNSDMDDVMFELGQKIIFALEILVVAELIQTLTKGLDSYNLNTIYLIVIVVGRKQLGKMMMELEKKVAKNGNKKHR